MLWRTLEGGIYMLKVSHENNRTMCKICSKLTKIPRQHHWDCSGFFIVNLEWILHCSGVSLIYFEQPNITWVTGHFWRQDNKFPRNSKPTGDCLKTRLKLNWNMLETWYLVQKLPPVVVNGCKPHHWPGVSPAAILEISALLDVRHR